MALQDFRLRYALYHTDPALQALHAALPMIAVWDDHEFADDTWRGGASDHDESASPFSERRAAAVQAYREWLPIRMPDAANPDRIYRSFDFGELVSLHMLDTRLIGRDQQINADHFRDKAGRIDVDAYTSAVADPSRNMLGSEQLRWLDGQVAASRARWQVLGQQVLMANMAHPLPVIEETVSLPDLQTLRELERAVPERLTEDDRAVLQAESLPWYLDSWDGYPAERERVFDIMRRRGKNLLVLAGDTHNAWASDLTDQQNRRVGVEFATSSISSPGLETCYDMAPVDIAAMYRTTIPGLRYAETSRRGYIVITATRTELTCDYHFVDRADSRSYTASLGKTLRTLPGPAGRTVLDA
jgi:alkaline phosphatase D